MTRTPTDYETIYQLFVAYTREQFDADERETIGRHIDALSDWNLRVLVNVWLEDIEAT